MSELLKRDKKYIWHPFTQLVDTSDPLVVKSAKGAYLYTEDGREILDAVSSWWVNLHGHSHPYIAAAVAKQAQELEHVIFAGFTHEPAINVAENILSILPDNQSKAFFSDNGSTAIEVALKMTFQHWYNQGIERKKTIAFNGAYHGDTFGAMSVGDRGPFSAPFSPYLFDVAFVDCPIAGKESTVLKKFMSLVDQGDVGAFIFEPLVLGSAGMLMYSPEVLDEMISYAQINGVICIADEVFTGFGRTGKLFAADHLTHKPDIFALSKGLTGGTMALGLTTCTEKIIEVYRDNDLMKTFFHGHSFTANPIACASANASFDLLMDSACQNQIAQLVDLQKYYKEKLENHPKLREVRQFGTILALEFDTTDDTSYANEVKHKLYPFFLDRNILLRPLGNIIYVLPPYIITKEEMATVYGAIDELLEEIELR
jgi:adenosylmethionine-8-amino-7-oxononanoate aminotransferase